ncbi:MAG: hypothetical protein LQ343_004010 [Gyalolechia ehrenbergii]|nr:MAG: hypothetical protein LQ343_004010 [Gyalolechia ehrenbergii]
MAEVDAGPTFGAELKDGFRPVNAWVSNGVAWLDDLQQFYRERSVIEKEYSQKLYSLAKKHFEKKARKSSSLSVGDTPTLTPGSLECASLTTWTAQLSTLESRAAEHDRYASELILQIADPLKNLATRYEELRKSHAEYAAKLERERDSSYGELKKTKGRYDGACQEVENRRKKTESSFDHGKTKAQNAYQQQVMDMHNVKNTYIISINVTNKHKERYYHEYLPDVLDSLQDLSETRTQKVNSIWSHVVQLETSTLGRSTDHLQRLGSEIACNDPHLDSHMFLQHNIAPWQEPPDMVFEPSPVWLDDSSMAVNESAKTYLRNVLSKSKGQLRQCKQDVDQKRREVENIKRIRQAIREGKDSRDEVEVVRTIFYLQDELHQVERKRLTTEVETSSITSVVGDLSLGAQNHNFKPQTFKIPTNCDLCGERIWGLSAKGFDCRDCGYTCHSKCELKVPPDCPGEQSKDERKKLKTDRQQAANAALPQSNGGPVENVHESPELSRSNTLNSLSSGYAASASRSRVPDEERGPDQSNSSSATNKPPAARRNRIVAPPPAQYFNEAPSNGPNGGGQATSHPSEARAKMLYPYQASEEGEISVDEGQEVTIVGPDGEIDLDKSFTERYLTNSLDGSGWTNVRIGPSQSGLVPATYLETLPNTASTQADRPVSSYSNSSTSLAGSMNLPGRKKGPAVAPKRGAKKLNYVEALYDYESRSDAEWSMSEGERFVLINMDAGDGWADVEKAGQTKSVPANYIQPVS